MGERYDAVIIGAGVIGAATAFELAKRGRRTLNVDALPAAGYGSTSASAACIRLYYSTLQGVALAYEGYLCWRDWAGHLGLPADAELARFVETGSVAIKAEANRHLRPVCALLERLGIPFEEWDAERLRREYPYFDVESYAPPRRPEDPEFGTSAGPLPGAVFFPMAGYVTDPQLAARNLQQAAERHGARFRFNSKVVAIRRAGGRAAGVTLADGTEIEAPVVVNVAGPHSGAVNRLAGVTDDMAVGTRPLRQEVAYLPPPPEADFARKPLLCSDTDIGCYMRSDVGRQAAGRRAGAGVRPARVGRRPGRLERGPDGPVDGPGLPRGAPHPDPADPGPGDRDRGTLRRVGRLDPDLRPLEPARLLHGVRHEREPVQERAGGRHADGRADRSLRGRPRPRRGPAQGDGPAHRPRARPRLLLAPPPGQPGQQLHRPRLRPAGQPAVHFFRNEVRAAPASFCASAWLVQPCCRVEAALMAGAAAPPFRHWLMKLLRPSPFRFFAEASALQFFIFICWAVICG